MSAIGGRGTLDPPSDGDHVAPVVPLRRRQPPLAVIRGVRRALPRERAPFDPEIIPDDGLLEAERSGRLAGSVVALRASVARVRAAALPSRLGAGEARRGAVAVALVAAVIVTGALVGRAALSSRPGPVTSASTLHGADVGTLIAGAFAAIDRSVAVAVEHVRVEIRPAARASRVRARGGRASNANHASSHVSGSPPSGVPTSSSPSAANQSQSTQPTESTRSSASSSSSGAGPTGPGSLIGPGTTPSG